MFERKKNKGFTLIELVMVIVILAILAVVAIPQFFDLSGQAETSAEQGVVGGVRAGISAFQADVLAGGGAAPGYPATLEAPAQAVSTDCTTVAPCFTEVLGQGGITQDWATGAAANTYVGPTGTTYTYTPGNGAFQQ